MEDPGVTPTSDKRHHYAFFGIAVTSFFALLMIVGVIIAVVNEPTAQEKCQTIADTYGYLEANGTESGCMLRKYNGRWVDTSHLSRADMLNYKEKHS